MDTQMQIENFAERLNDLDLAILLYSIESQDSMIKDSDYGPEFKSRISFLRSYLSEIYYKRSNLNFSAFMEK